jgi:cell division protease FtsH
MKIKKAGKSSKRKKGKTAPRNPQAVEDRRRTAYHEAGHVVVTWFSEHGANVLRARIVTDDNGASSGEVNDDADIGWNTKAQLLADIAAWLGGKVAEEIACGESSSAIGYDLREAMKTAKRMITRYAMSEKFGLRAYDLSKGDLSDAMKDAINAEIRAIVTAQAAVAKSILESHRDQLDAIAKALLERGKLKGQDLHDLLGPHARATVPARS